MNLKHYILNKDKKPVLCSLDSWAIMFGKATERTVARDHIGKVKVSTVFLGLDHNFSGQGRPVLFETMIFGGQHDQAMWRYCTWDEALAGHAYALALVKGKPKPKAKKKT